MYQVLARKYRPRNFIELVGQNHVSRALTSALERGRLHHAYLFTGTRGVGKTTIARILAKCLNCETGVTSTPCEVCPTCKAVNEGRFIDLIEIDAASRTKVEDTRELLDNVPYAPTQGRFKVYLIDEVHMLSTHSFNALLKTLEEPPEHVKFLFATTDPQKLPITVISRCLQFTLRPLAVDEITSHLTDILQKEQIQAEQDAIWQIAESAQGSLRDALSLTDQAIAYGQGSIQHQDVKDMLGLIDRTIIYDLILAIHQNQRERVSALLMQFRQQALDVSLVLDQLISTLHELALLQYLPDLALKYSAEINQKIMQLSQLISAQDLQLYYQVACKGRADLQLAVTQEQGFEMCVLRLLAFRPLQPNEMLVSAVQQESAAQPQLAQNQAETVQPTQTQSLQQPNTVVESAAQVATVEQPEAVPAVDTSPAFDDFDDSHYDDDDGYVSAPAVDEPSSDDFLDDPEEDAISQTSTASTANGTLDTQEVAPVESVSTQQNDTLVMDAVAEDTLFDLDPTPSTETEEVDVSAINFEDIAPLEPTALESKSVEPETAQPHLINAIEPQHVVNESVSGAQGDNGFDLASPQVTQSSVSSDAVQTGSSSTLMPQDILTLQPQTLEGEWTVEKWEYWFRNSQLSPAVQELAQHGIMRGTIDGESTFHIPKRYEALVTQLQHVLEQAIHAQWSKCRFHISFEDVEETTPFALQHVRKEKAFARANELLHAEPVVKDLLKSFDGELQNIQLK
ncbi:MULTISPECIES: DNA polymerase III subunit gamma/tau [unclassified Acinetobacter]|uniref:DNA polymerase III subunit gamma/tau n=1 Tax=unclassified Acinetobacter TaxID=196816 RepID=UPI0015D396DF|nr:MULTISPECIES: DNA polymerase III subunit gamma/tau [unclassified Acinetobacter]UUS66312.1 DNA polymerase III subunit gamma/tau [Acinetobacter sp. YH12068_T]